MNRDRMDSRQELARTSSMDVNLLMAELRRIAGTSNDKPRGSFFRVLRRHLSQRSIARAA